MRVRILLVTLVAALGSRCGFLADPYISEAYVEAFFPESVTECLVTWPLHAVALPVVATADQGIRTVEAVVPAGRDAVDYVYLDFTEHNVMLSRTVAIPKLVATPLIFVGSYVARWFYPFERDERPFVAQEEEYEEYPPGKAEKLEQPEPERKPEPPTN